MASILELLRRLSERGVDFVLVGGMASTVHGSAVVTEDLDVCIRFDEPTLAKVLDALEGLRPRLRMTPERPELSKDPKYYVGWQNLYVVSDAGQIDFLGAVTGVGSFEVVARNAIPLDLGGFVCRVMGLDDLIASKRALGRPKDLRVVAELEAVRRRLPPKPD